MDKTFNVDLTVVAENLNLPLEQIQSAVELLEQGNTIPFIARYRRDETRNLAERSLRAIKDEVARLRGLAERKSIILKSIESQGQLTDKLRKEIESTHQSRRLEDLYLPFKPKKQSLAATARQQGLEPLARDVLEDQTSDVDLATRATEFVRIDKGLNNIDEVIDGVKHLLAERFAERIKLRKELRKLYLDHAVIKTQFVDATAPEDGRAASPPADDSQKTAARKSSSEHAAAPENQQKSTSEPVATPTKNAAADDNDQKNSQAVNVDSAITESAGNAPPQAESSPSPVVDDQTATGDVQPEADAKQETSPHGSSDTPAAGPSEPGDNVTDTPPATASIPPAAKPAKTNKRKAKKKRNAFEEFRNFEEPVKKIPPHRILAINRGERAGKLKCRLSVAEDQIHQLTRSTLIPENHQFADFLWDAAETALHKSILPSIEREIRRELTEKAETHAVNVFSRNLRHLFLQPPVRGQRILAIDPGFRTGCKAACLDELGNPLGYTTITIVGNQQRRQQGREALVELINQHQPTLIAIGNGNGCRATEQLVSDILQNEVADRSLKYTIVNQAGTSAYSTSEIAREELPNHEPVIRSAISIGRRLLDPLSELVKVNPANIGVGMYQHDVKSKHLQDSLESELESCVNFVGANVNTASVSLLKFVAGLGPLTARNLIEHRQEQGPFTSREQLKQVPRFGEVTFLQAAGFLRIADGENPLDRTSIHPESYEIANRIMQRIGGSLDDLFLPTPPATPTTAHAGDNATSTETPSTETPSNETPLTEKPPTEQSPTKTPSTDSTSVAVPADPSTTNVDVKSTETSLPPTARASSESLTESDAADGPAAAQPDSSMTATATVAATPAQSSLSPAMLAEKRHRRNELIKKIKSLDATELAREFEIGEIKIRDILRALRFPQQDPREESPAPIFRQEILKIDDIKKGMQLRGQVVNVVDFGVFVDIGIGESCLVHISRLSKRFVRDPYWLYCVGDILTLWVQDVDLDKRRVTLTAIRPDSATPHRKPNERRGRRKRSDAGASRSKSSAGRGTHQTRHKRPRKRPSKPKPVTPITDGMVQGKEPMRSFSDLLQYHERQANEDKSPPPKSE